MPRDNMAAMRRPPDESQEALAEGRALGEKLWEQEGKPPRPCGYFLLVRLGITPEKVGSIHIPIMTQREDQFSSIYGRCIMWGHEAYAGDRYRESGPWCYPGDYVMIARREGMPFTYDKVPYVFLPDDRVFGVIDDASKLLRILVPDKV